MCNLFVCYDSYAETIVNKIGLDTTLSTMCVTYCKRKHTHPVTVKTITSTVLLRELDNNFRDQKR